ncbi:hypothetical protein ACTXT7_010199 [Hymenolepis weldensis]
MDSLPRARIIHLTKWPNTDGYGFVLKDSKSKEYRIGSVEANLPAESAGIMENDILIEVNGQPTNDMAYADVVRLIKQLPDKVTLMVLQPYEKNVLTKRGIKLTSSACPAQIIRGRRHLDDTTSMVCRKMSDDTLSKSLLVCDAATAARLSKTRLDLLSSL